MFMLENIREWLELEHNTPVGVGSKDRPTKFAYAGTQAACTLCGAYVPGGRDFAGKEWYALHALWHRRDFEMAVAIAVRSMAEQADQVMDLRAEIEEGR